MNYYFMALPQRTQFYYLILECLNSMDGQASVDQIEEWIVEKLKISVADRTIMHTSTRPELAYQLAWARTELKISQLIENPSRSIWKLTMKGIGYSDEGEKSVINHVNRVVRNDRVSELEIESELVANEPFDDNLEPEDSGGELIDSPFNPKEVDVTSRMMSLDLIYKRLRRKEIDLYTDFQREGNLWNKTKQSRLIESVLINFPLPAFYFDGSNEGKWLVVDGLQRLSAFHNFVIDKNFDLENLEFLHQFNGFGFDELPRELQRRLEESEVTAYIINDGTPDLVKYILFKRINTGGLILEPQEIRHAMNQGAPARFIKELAELKSFKQATAYSVRSHRMLDRDFANRFVAFYLIGPEKYRPDLDTFLNDGMAMIKRMNEQEKAHLKGQFKQAMEVAYEIFRNDAFRKRYRENERRKPINKALFEVFSVSFAKLSADDAAKLVKKSSIFRAEFIRIMNDQDFHQSVSQSTGDKSRVRRRFEKVREIITNTLNSQ